MAEFNKLKDISAAKENYMMGNSWKMSSSTLIHYYQPH